MNTKSHSALIDITPQSLKPCLPKRPDDSHKGNFGSALFIGGSTRYTGAALLAGKACLRSGIGYLSMAVPAPLHTSLSGQIPEAIWYLLPESDGKIAASSAELLKDVVPGKTAILIGPGLTVSESSIVFAESFFREIIANYTETPIVCDADMLTILSQSPGLIKYLPQCTVLTPHPGEMARLTCLDVDEVQANRAELARKFATEKQLTVVLKGANTIIASPNGQLRKLNFAHSVLAHAGSGDVLAGLLTGLLGQGIPAFEAACLAVWLHAKSGLLALEKRKHAASVLPSDLVNYIGHAMNALENA